MRRVAFLSETTAAASPSVWVNATLLEPWLRSAGWQLDVMPPPGASLIQRFGAVPGVRGVAYSTLVPALRRVQLARAAQTYDVAIVHKALTDMSLPPRAERHLRRRHGAIIFNFDDAVYERGVPYVADRIRLADAVWVGREDLARYAREHNDNVYVIGSAVDCSHFPSRQDFASSGPLELVWTGTSFSHPYLEMLRTPLEQLAARLPYRLSIVSGTRFTFDSPSIADAWIPYSVAAERAALARADIALMPLADGPYERAKENYKIKIYQACGLPVICSPVGANRELVEHDVSGWWAADAAEWLAGLEALGGDAQLRRRIGQAGRAFIERNFDIPVVGPRVLAMLEAVAAGRPAAAAGVAVVR